MKQNSWFLESLRNTRIAFYQLKWYSVSDYVYISYWSCFTKYWLYKQKSNNENRLWFFLENKVVASIWKFAKCLASNGLFLFDWFLVCPRSLIFLMCSKPSWMMGQFSRKVKYWIDFLSFWSLVVKKLYFILADRSSTRRSYWRRTR